MATQDRTSAKKREKPKFHTYPFWSPRFWHGMLPTDWFRLAARGRFRIHPLRVPMAFLLTLIVPVNTVLRLIQKLVYGRRIAETEIEHPPVFIIGHWRSGTTFLHELLMLDDRFAYPNTYECFAPHHFLISEWFFVRFANFLLPKQRPMDNVSAGWKRPQEDEFALLAMGAPTPYVRMAFPNEPPPFMEYLDMQGLDERGLQRWKSSLGFFIRSLSCKFDNKRIILKSPPHTGRVQVLSEMFPGARFIHIVRDPYSIVPSTRRLWQSLDGVQGFQLPKHKELDEYVFGCYERMYGGFEKQRESIDPEQICEVRYEDLVKDPVGEVQAVYEKLGLGDFEDVREKLEEVASKQGEYKTNQHRLDPELKAEIQRRWAGYFERYGYEVEP